jgi:hypothetical protein
MSGVSNVSMNMDVENVGRLLSPLADSETVPSLALVAGIHLNAQSLDPVDGVSAIYENMPGTAIQYFFDTDQAFQWSWWCHWPCCANAGQFQNDLAQ